MTPTPTGQQHFAHPLDALACAPILLHALALARGDAAAYTGLPPGFFEGLALSPVSSFESGGGAGGVATGVAGAGGVLGALGCWLRARLAPRPGSLHKRCLRLLAAYVFLGALQSGGCGGLHACSAAAALMLVGRRAAGFLGVSWAAAGGGGGGYRFESVAAFQSKKRG